MLSPEESIIVEHMLIDDEGLKQFPYFDCCGKQFRRCTCKEQGKLTLGVGRNIEDVGISENEATGLLSNDVKRVTAIIERNFPWFAKINVARRVVIVAMVFNMGLETFKTFTKMINRIESGDFYSASKEMLNSEWSAQVKSRAVRLSKIFEKGEF